MSFWSFIKTSLILRVAAHLLQRLSENQPFCGPCLWSEWWWNWRWRFLSSSISVRLRQPRKARWPFCPTSPQRAGACRQNWGRRKNISFDQITSQQYRHIIWKQKGLHNLLFGLKKFQKKCVNLNGKFCVKSVQISTAKFVSNDLSNLSNNSGVIAVLANLILFAFSDKRFAKNSK